MTGQTTKAGRRAGFSLLPATGFNAQPPHEKPLFLWTTRVAPGFCIECLFDMMVP